MRVLLTGVTGFLGSHLAHAFVASGHEISAVMRRNSDTKRIRDILNQLQIFRIDTSDSERLWINGSYDVIVHTATCYGRGSEPFDQLVSTNVAFPLRLLTNAVSLGETTFINTDTSLDSRVNAYALSKVQFVEWGKRLTQADSRLRFVNLRLEQFFGPGDDPAKFTGTVFRACVSNEPELHLTLGEQERDFIFIDDVVSAYMVLLDKVPSQCRGYLEYQIGSGKPVTIRRFVETVHREAMSQTRLCFGAVQYRSGEPMRSCANTTLLEELGWKCKISLEEGIRNTVLSEKSGCAC